MGRYQFLTLKNRLIAGIPNSTRGLTFALVDCVPLGAILHIHDCLQVHIYKQDPTPPAVANVPKYVRIKSKLSHDIIRASSNINKLCWRRYLVKIKFRHRHHHHLHQNIPTKTMSWQPVGSSYMAYREFTWFEANIKPCKFSLFQCEVRILSSLYINLCSVKRH